MRHVITLIVVLLVSIVGCSYVYDLWPVRIPSDTTTYLKIDPNSIGWPSIAKLRELREKTITQNIFFQSNLAYQMDLDKKLYDRAIDQANFNISQAEQERQTIVGTIQNPGWLLSFLLPTMGAVAARGVSRLQWYTEAELQQKITEATATKT